VIEINTQQEASVIDEKDLLGRVSKFSVAINKKAYLELAFTLGTFFVLFALMIYGLSVSYWITFGLLIPTAALLTRAFTIQHDCGHYAYFSSHKVNKLTGNLLGVLTLTPFHYWRRTHRFHHTACGNLDKRGIGDLDTFTLKEYKSLPLYRKLWYRIYRNPAFMLVVGPIAVFGLKHRLPLDNPFNSVKTWVNIMFTNLGVGVIMASLVYFFGWEALLYIYFPVCLLASAIGIALFFIHHQYEDMYWAKDDEWSHFKTALYGSSYFEFSSFPSWIISNINLHHIHHMNDRVPFYRLRECLEAIPELRNVPRRTFRDIPACFRLALWDEDRKEMVGFSAA
jgi:omega-6 fatty acid desaturase (delta-12 desaturase)